MRSDQTDAIRRAQMNTSRATVREFDDNHLLQEVKAADVFHSETATNFERFQMVGLTSMPLKQEEDQKQQKQQQTQDDGFNHNQPKGKSAEAVMLYPGGRSHPIAIVDDRRVRPYALKEGETALYAASGTGQMVFHNDDGSHLVATNNPPEQSKENKDKERYASLRHVKKKKQPREIKEGQKIEDPKHQGETINLELRCTSTRIEFRAGDTVVGYYDKAGKKWVLIGEIHLGSEDADHPVYGVNSGVGKTTKVTGDGAVLVKAPLPGPPTSQDLQP